MLLDVNKNIEPDTYGKDTYYNEPDVMRGDERKLKGRQKEKLDQVYDD